MLVLRASEADFTFLSSTINNLGSILRPTKEYGLPIIYVNTLCFLDIMDLTSEN